MVGKLEYTCVPTSVELENTGNHRKYTVNKLATNDTSSIAGTIIVISKFQCFLFTMGAICLAIVVGLLVFFLRPECITPVNHLVIDGDSQHASNGFSDKADSVQLENPPVVDERLPTDIKPIHYTLQIIPYFDNLTTSGTIEITVYVERATKQIIFNIADIEINPSSVQLMKTSDEKLLEIEEQSEISAQQLYAISLIELLEENTTYNLSMQYNGQLNKHLQGFYRSKYESKNRTHYLASTQFSPTDARRAFPCFDEPEFKATFSISIARPIHLKSISNMPIDRTDDFGNGWQIDHYPPTPKMSTYLVAFIVSDLELTTTTSTATSAENDLFRIGCRPSLLNQTGYAKQIAPQILRFLGGYFDSPFPLPKIDIVAVPEFGFSAMENWGLITFRESALLYDSNADVDNIRDIATILAHEIGHQWFGNLVTPKWWDDLWLKEGFASYLEYLGVQFIEPKWKIQEEFFLSETQAAFQLDAFESSRPISSDVKNSKQIRQAFDKLSYSKGACIIRMMNNFLGEDTFKTGLINFIKKYKYSNANHQDLFQVLTEEAHKTQVLESNMNVEEIMKSWTIHEGFPVISAIGHIENKKITISQKRFYYTNEQSNSTTWWIPISYTTNADKEYSTRPFTWLSNERIKTIDANYTNWFLLNMEQTGYYIVNYDVHNWQQLTRHIMDIPPVIRAQLISDSMDLARAGMLGYDVPLKLIGKMALLDEQIMYIPTAMAFKKLSFLSDILTDTSAFQYFETYHSEIFKNTYETVNDDEGYYSDNYLQQKIRKTVLKWACRERNSPCSIRAQHMFRNWMQLGYEVPPNMREITYCTAIREGTKTEWKFAKDSYLRTNSASEKNVLLDALGCTTDTSLLSSYLNLLLQMNSSIRIQDADRVFHAIASNNVGSRLAFQFLRRNWNELLIQFGEGFSIISKMVSCLPKFINSEYQLNELIRFKEEVSTNIATTNQAFDNAIEIAKSNVKWMEKHYKTVEQWLKSHNDKYDELKYL